MNAYYNEHDTFAAEWLRQLITAGLVAPGYVDERDIRDVQPSDLAGYDRCHFFAGIGGWDYALQLAGWDGPVWTGSCPCQPFSAAGKRGGFEDSRHLWPTWFRLIRECKPPVVFGEQVASKAGLAWFDHVAVDLEAEGYAIGAADLGAASVGAPHIRQRLWFVADYGSERLEGRGVSERGRAGQRSVVERSVGSAGGDVGGLVQSDSQERAIHLPERRPQQALPTTGGTGTTGRLGDSASEQVGRTGQPRQDFWRDLVWLPCRDGKARPTKPDLLPLAHGIPGRVGLLRGAGNAIVPQVAAEFIKAWLEVMGHRGVHMQVGGQG